MPTAHNTIVPASQKLTADLEEAARLKAEISRLETDLKAVAARIVKVSNVKDQYQLANGKITVSVRTNRHVDLDVLGQVQPEIVPTVTETSVSWSKWDAANKLGLLTVKAKALVTASEGDPFLSYSLSTVK